MLNRLDFDAFMYNLAFGGSSYRGILNLTLRFQNTFLGRGEKDHMDDTCYQHVRFDSAMKELQHEAQENLNLMLTSVKRILLAGLRNLTTFSLTIDNEPDDGALCMCHEVVLKPHYFADIINALPPSCSYLELDTDGAGAQHRDESEKVSHTSLCRALHKILQQLQDIRLRVGAVCPDFFYGPHGDEQLHIDSSACQAWVRYCGEQVENEWYISRGTEPIRLNSTYTGPSRDMSQWLPWRALSDSDEKVGRETR